jgi:prophage maintenance system killer protein
MTAVRELTAGRLRRLDMRGLIAIHGELMARYGSKLNSEKSREVDMAMLELSIARSELVVRERHWRSRARLAAGYGWRLLVNRPFAVGNKRMALAAMVTCLEMNGLTWKCGEVEETVMVQRAAAKGIKEDEWEAWVVRNVGKRTLQLGR